MSKSKGSVSYIGFLSGGCFKQNNIVMFKYTGDIDDYIKTQMEIYGEIGGRYTISSDVDKHFDEIKNKIKGKKKSDTVYENSITETVTTIKEVTGAKRMSLIGEKPRKKTAKDDKSDSDDDKPKKKTDKKKNDSDDSEEESEDEKPKKKVVKKEADSGDEKPKKKVVKKDDDSEDEKPKKKVVKKDADSEDEKPKKATKKEEKPKKAAKKEETSDEESS